MSTLATIDASDLISDSRTDINANFSALNTDKIETSVIDTDTSLAANSDAKIPSQKAVKSYVDSAGATNASTSVRGVVEEATQSEIDAGTAAGATGARLFINPSTAVASSTTKGLTYKQKIEVDTTEITHGNSTTETTLFDTTISGGTLGTNNALRFTVYVSSYDIESSEINILLKYGGTTIGTINMSSLSMAPIKGVIEGMVVADGATNAQKGFIKFQASANAGEAGGQASVGFTKFSGYANGTAAVDSTSNQTLAVTLDWGATGAENTLTAEFWVVELIA